MKKGTRLLIAGLLGIAVTGASTLAYFTSTATLNPNGGQVPLALNITNGTVAITAGVGNGTTTPTWSYDVATLSTSTATYELYSGAHDDQAPIGTITSADTGFAAYVLANRSKDIVGVDPTGATAGKMAVGAPLLTGTISNARPGDALVLGVAGGAEGINVTNSSSLTVKLKVVAKTDQATIDKIAALATAGWKMYVNGNVADVTNPATLQTALDSVATTLAPGASIGTPIKIRLELPLTTTDAKQGLVLDTDTGTAGTQAFDVSSLFTIMATQENNPGWTNAGN